jgi:hypothetical protein
MIRPRCLFLFLCVCGVTSSNMFDHLDLNQDGVLDRNEYDGLVRDLKAAIDPFTTPGAEFDPAVKSKILDILPSIDATSEDFISGVVNSLVVIWVTEIGDKTFFIAAVLAMRNGRMVVYLGAMGKKKYLGFCTVKVFIFLFSCSRCDACSVLLDGICSPCSAPQSVYTLCQRCKYSIN